MSRWYQTPTWISPDIRFQSTSNFNNETDAKVEDPLGVFICDGYLGGVCFVWGNKYLKGVTEDGYAAVMMLLIHRLTLLWRMLSGYIIFMPPR